LPGSRAGHSSLAALADLLEHHDLTALAGRFRGVFGLFVRNRASGDWQITCDNSGLYRVFHDGRRAAISFRELLKARTASAAQVDRARIVEFLAYGGLAGSATCVQGIARLKADEVLFLPGDGSPGAIRPKALKSDAPAPADEELVRHFDDLARSLVRGAKARALKRALSGA